MATQTRRTIATNKTIHDRRRILGLGASGDMSVQDVIATVKASSCPIWAMPTVAKTQWDLQGPISNADVQKTFGATINVFASSSQNDPPGVDAVYSTPGLINGEFQTPVLACAIAVHLEISPFMCVVPGNAFARPTSPPIAKPFSPDAWTTNDQASAWSASTPPTSRALLMYGEPAARAMWCMVRAYNLRWTYGSLKNIIDDQLRETAYMPPNGQEGSASSSEIDALRIAREVNDRYASLSPATTNDFAIIDTVRTGSVGSDPNVGVFTPSNDFYRVPVTYGGADLRSKIGIGQNSEFRTLINPWIIKSGVPIGMTFEEQNTVLANLMRAELDVTQGIGGAAPAIFTESSDFALTAGSAFNERTIDGLTVAQHVIAETALFKGFNLLISNEVKGYELSEWLYHQILRTPEVGAALCSECGVLCAWG